MCSKKEPPSPMRWLSAVASAAIQRKMVPVLWDTGGVVSRREPYAASDEVKELLRKMKHSPVTAMPELK